MAGVNVDSGGKGRRALDSEINMIPMIDLLMVTISFLLITAVWVHSQRLSADAQVPGSPPDTPPCQGDECKEEMKLHVQTSDPTKYVLAWKQGSTVVRTVDVARDPRSLADKVAGEWQATGQHREAADKKFDRAVVHAPNDMRYAELIAVMDAVAQQKRPYALGAGKVAQTSAFDVTFAAD